jgi:hypothetical protein
MRGLLVKLLCEAVNGNQEPSSYDGRVGGDRGSILHDKSIFQIGTFVVVQPFSSSDCGNMAPRVLLAQWYIHFVSQPNVLDGPSQLVERTWELAGLFGSSWS